MKKQNKYDILARFIEQFKGNNWILSKFLIDNKAISDSFIKKINIDFIESEQKGLDDIDAINNHFDSLISRTEGETIEDMEKKLKSLVEEERYEEAARIRDFIKKINSKK